MSVEKLALYEELCSDDRHRIEQATRRLTQQVRAMAIRQVTGNSGTYDDADDLTQEVVMAVWRQIRAGSYQPQPDVPFEAYLYRLVRNNWLKVLRQRRQQGGHDEVDENLPAADLPMDSRFDRVERAFGRLGALCQRVLRLFYWEGYSMEEIADQLDTTVDAAKQRKYRCMLTLGDMLGTNN